MATETTPLVDETGTPAGIDFAKDGGSKISLLLSIVQIVVIAFFIAGTEHSSESFKEVYWNMFRDIMVMLLLGFGYLMTFLRKYGLGAVGFTMMLTVVAMQVNIPVEMFCRFLNGDDTAWPLSLSIENLIDAEFAAATFLISFGAIIGRATPSELVFLTLLQSFWYAFNKVVIVGGLLGAEDIGGTITIHMFGAFFGLAVAKAMGPQLASSASNADADQISDVLCLVGTTLLWVYWPSFVGATVPEEALQEGHCITNTIMALLGSTLASFYLSQVYLGGKFDPVHIANSTLAGGVAVGSSARLAITPGGALVLGVLAGLISVTGYSKISPWLEDKFALHDVCGVGNLHGWPSVLGGLASIVFIGLVDPGSPYYEYSVASQCLRQFLAVVATILVAVVTGFFSGKWMLAAGHGSFEEYEDALWWEEDYLKN